MRIKIKICGVTNVADANLVASLGADYLGLNFYKDSPRKVSLKMAKDIVSKMPPFTIPIGVFVDENIDELVKTVKKSGIKMVQLHGGESPEYCRQVKEKTTLPVIKAFRVSDETIFENILTYKDSCDYYLFDAYL
jgi:phosphoribosylanthranilate isomerase